MGTKIREKTSLKKVIRFKHKRRISHKVRGNEQCPRLSVFRSNKYLYAQLIDDVKGCTIASASMLEEDLKNKAHCTIEGAKILGGLIAKRALAKEITRVVFDRSGYLYHGRIKALADAARDGGLKF